MLLLFTKRNNFYLPKVKFHCSLATFVAALHTASFTDKLGSRVQFCKKWDETLREGLRNNFAHVCKILALNLFDISRLFFCCYRKVENRHQTCRRFSKSFWRCLPWSSAQCIFEIHLLRVKCLGFSLLSSFFRRGNGLKKMEFIGMTRRTKEIEIEEELMVFNIRDT